MRVRAHWCLSILFLPIGMGGSAVGPPGVCYKIYSTGLADGMPPVVHATVLEADEERPELTGTVWAEGSVEPSHGVNAEGVVDFALLPGDHVLHAAALQYKRLSTGTISLQRGDSLVIEFRLPLQE